MARNKYPEETVARILEVARRLFMEKGYDNTKGAVYHHFKSKEEIMDAVCDQMFYDNNPFEAVRQRTDLNALEKLREAIRLNQADESRVDMTIQAIPITRNPRLMAEMVESNRRVLTPYYLELLEEGNRDGSIHTEYAREIAELLPLLTSLWLLPSVFPASREEQRRKFTFLGEMLDKMGVPLMDDSIRAVVDAFFDRMPPDPADKK